MGNNQNSTKNSKEKIYDDKIINEERNSSNVLWVCTKRCATLTASGDDDNDVYDIYVIQRNKKATKDRILRAIIDRRAKRREKIVSFLCIRALVKWWTKYWNDVDIDTQRWQQMCRLANERQRQRPQRCSIFFLLHMTRHVNFQWLVHVSGGHFFFCTCQRDYETWKMCRRISNVLQSNRIYFVVAICKSVK